MFEKILHIKLVHMTEFHQIMCHLHSHFQNLIPRKEKLVQIDTNVI